MISKETIKKLADLARIEVSDSEQEELAKEIDAILGYVGQVSEIVGSVPPLNVRGGQGGDIEEVNVFREDANPTPSGTYTDRILAEAPATEGGYIKVKKILG